MENKKIDISENQEDSQIQPKTQLFNKPTTKV
jgi:hypothetical protein